jgi:glycosyltransferase involved in cell wall biosynthesis
MTEENLSPPLPVLVISWAFAPDREIGAKRVTRFCNYLPDFRVRPLVLTVQERFLEHRDDEFLPPSGIRIERTNVIANPLDAYARLRCRILSRNTAGDSHYGILPTQGGPDTRPRGLRRHLMALLNSPDRYQGWYLPAVRAANRLIQREPGSAILSSGPPFTSHLIARHLRKKHGIPWVADYRDGWATNPNLTGEGVPEWIVRMNSKMEASCVRWADLVICNTEPLRRSFLQRYPPLGEERFVTLTNGYDDAVKPPPKLKSGSKSKLFLHSGSIYGSRRIGTFCQAVNSLVSAGSLNPGSFRILFHGEISSSSLFDAHQYAHDLIKNHQIEFEPFLDSWQDGQRILWTADILLVFSGSPLEVPAKFYEYLKTGKPIFAVSEKGALTDLLDLTGTGVWADPGDSSAIAAGLLKALQMNPVSPEEVTRRWDNRFHFRSLTGKLAGWLRNLAEGKPLGGK